MTLEQLFNDGGWMMWPLAACSVLGLAVILAKAVTLYLARIQAEEFLGEVSGLVEQGRVEEAITRCEETRGPVAAIMLTGLLRWDEGRERVEGAIEAVGNLEMAFLERGLVALATIAHVAPLMGFLGTVAGMILAFGEIAELGEVDAAAVAGGIKVALITTATGLSIAIPINLAHNFFVTRIDRFIVDMEKAAIRIGELVDRLMSPGARRERIAVEEGGGGAA